MLDVAQAHCARQSLTAACPRRLSASSLPRDFSRPRRRISQAELTLHQGSATAIPLGDASVDVVVSGLMLNFVPDPRAAVLEMVRVTGKEGTIAAYVWDYAGRMEAIRFFWDAASELDSDAAKLDEGVRFPLCRPEPLEALFASAGLEQVELHAIDIATPFANFDDYWDPFLGGQGPAPAYAMSLGEAARQRLRDRLRQRIRPSADGVISLTARAWAIRGTITARNR